VVKTQAELFAEQAEDAFRRGRDLLAAGQAEAALPWIERARRFAPEDDTLRYTLGLAWLRAGEPARAAPLLAAVAQRCDAREPHIALASAHASLGQAEPAAAALAAVLSRHVLAEDAGFAALADGIVRAAGAAGWCGRRRDGSIVATAAGRLLATLDGRPIAARRLRQPPGSGMLALASDGRALLGSPLDLAGFGRVEGFVEVRDGGLAGWAWHPADPDTSPEIIVQKAGGATLLRLTAEDGAMVAERALARPRRFVVPADRLGGAAADLLEVLGADGRGLIGSPLRVDLPPDDASLPAGTAAARPNPSRAVAVVVAVHGGGGQVLDCLESVLASVPPGTTLIVVDDAGPEPDLARALDAMAAERRIVLRRNTRNLGFPASANIGLGAASALPGRPDVVLLNSDTLVPRGWLEGLRAAVHAAGDIGTATPLSNDATILSYPVPHRPNPAPDAAGLRSLAALTARVGRGKVVDIPTAVGFCMYIRRECLAATGRFREDAFAQGYGEENDFCRRASRLGWRHVAVPGVFVAHLGGVSFGAARARLLARNAEVLERLHPGYRALVATHVRVDPLAGIRRRLDAARFRAGAASGSPAVLLVTHDHAGGVERAVRCRCEALWAAGKRAVLLRPVRAAEGERFYEPGLCSVVDATAGEWPNLRFALPAELPALARLLGAARPEAIEVHHLLGHDHAIMQLPARLAVPYDVYVHDYAWLCPRITLLGPSNRYCGEPESVGVCAACIAEAGSALEEPIGVAALRARSAADLAGARRVVTPSLDAATRLRRHFPSLAPQASPLEDDAALAPRAPPPDGVPTRVAVIGGIGPAKGYDVLLACARDAAERALPLSFIVVGHTPDDATLLATGRAFVTGPYAAAEAVDEIRAQRAHLAFLPSVFPETWCYTLGEGWRAGLDVVVFDIGAQAERVRRSGRGWILPLGLPPAAINNALLAVRPRAGHECPPA
jgi:GT2 family glycosyltransferase/glycosyltransferase involved in cell wall biosynthesis